MIKFVGYEFVDEKACLICEHVYMREADPKIIVHDFDGWLQILCGTENHDPEKSKTVSLNEIIERLPKGKDLPLLAPGFFAEQKSNGVWVVADIEDG